VSDSGAGPLDTSLLFDVFALGQSVGRLLTAAMRDGPLAPAEYAVYSAIFELEAASPTRLAARLGMRLTTFVDQLRVIEGRGHAARVDNPGDRRSYRVVLTAAGLEAHRAANRQFEAAHRAVVDQLVDGEDRARRDLLHVRRAVEAAAATPVGTDSATADRLVRVSPRRRGGRGG
jgi:DNA-binding MarR family transcriptional regulator